MILSQLNKSFIKFTFKESLDLSSLAREAKNPLLTPGPDPSSPSNFTRIWE